MANLKTLNLIDNELGPEGASALAGALSSMANLTTLTLDENPTVVDWNAVSKFVIPSEVIEQGWIPTLKFLRKLRDGSEKCSQLRLLLLGDGTAGKTSFLRAMQSESGTTGAIALDERTIAIDVRRNWVVPGGGGLEFQPWDFGGQKEYHTTHSPYLSARCMIVMVYRPIGEDEQYLSAGQLMDDFLQTWFQMIHSHIPSARIVLVCTRWCTPPAGVDLAAHQARVSAV
ncbi:hypothetical protein T484DRAFT_3124325 [Baffinella frigidus]|nr:hypothetical protein T484DRAFT_3124325 [Cryptophyta sp. CCMP2293]